ncbi:sulfotransferase [Formosa sediminum]|uniref:Sulfotransferase n=1 Tax=Formosa sediminum TaxID=2594004 RepID=A0A516GUI9_9FLAO|nr:sulfotransferase [Formosa sediminum]QDO95176.1 sulfotransferase [Formosa sediminum]
MIKNKAIQIIGTQRSGSNLLRVMLNQIEAIDAPHPPHILQRFYPLLATYGNLNIELNFLKLIDDVCKLIEFNPVPWQGFTLDRKAIRKQCETNTLLEVFKVIYNLKATHAKANYWCCKSMANINYIDVLEASNIKPIYIHLYRDGRDVALSFKNAIVGPKHTYHLAKKWKTEQELCLKLKHSVAPNRFFSLCYEDLITKPKVVLQELCTFLNIPFNTAMLNYYQSEESLKTAASGKMWKNVSQPILTHNCNKFLTEMKSPDILLFESIAGTTLSQLNYSLYTDGFYKLITEDDIEAFHQENEILKQTVLSMANTRDISRKQPQLQLLKEIQNRGTLQVANI